MIMMDMDPALAMAPSGGGVWNLLLYVIAVCVGLFLFATYEPKVEKEEDACDASYTSSRPARRMCQRSGAGASRFSSLFAVLGLSMDKHSETEAFTEHFSTFEEVSGACKAAGLRRSNLIIGIDFTASNEWQGRKTFNQNCLHKIMAHRVYNPYQKVIWIVGQTLAPFDEDQLIPAFGFGDSTTRDVDIFPLTGDDHAPACRGFQEVLDRYNDVVKGITLSGPTSFAPIIYRAIEIVKQTNKYHILVIIADGQVSEEEPTLRAIVAASEVALSIVVVGVGDGPWDVMEDFDSRIPARRFDNFRFVDYHKATFKSKNPDTAFALQALMEIPDQYKKIVDLGYIEDCRDTVSMTSAPRDPHDPFPTAKTPRLRHKQWSQDSSCGGSLSPQHSPTHTTTAV